MCDLQNPLTVIPDYACLCNLHEYKTNGKVGDFIIINNKVFLYQENMYVRIRDQYGIASNKPFDCSTDTLEVCFMTNKDGWPSKEVKVSKIHE